MYFAVVARHCERCPAGQAGIIPLVITVAVGILAMLVLTIVVLLQLHDVERRVTLQKHGECEYNATGPIARLFLNWMQATSLLSTIKLTPPEMVKDVSVLTDYAQGISTDWYFIACTIRLTVWTTFAWNLVAPLLSALLPALLIIAGTPVKRKATAIGLWWSSWWAKASVSAVAEQRIRDRVVEHDESTARANENGGCEMTIAADSGEPQADVSITSRDQIDGDVVRCAASDEPDSDATSSDGDDAGAAAARTRRRIFDARAGWFTNVSGRAIVVRDAPSPDARRLAFAVLPGDHFRAEEQRAIEVAPSTRVEYLRLAGEWGAGWVPMTFGRATAIIRVRASTVVTDARYRKDAAPPACRTQRNISSGGDSDGGEESGADAETQFARGDIDEATHRFRALEALCPEGGITRDVIELCYPLKTPQKILDEVFEMFDDDGDGRLSLEEYRAADLTIRTTWRYRHLWRRFAAADVNRDGVLTDAEVSEFTPITVTSSGTAAWIAPFDTAGQFGAITIADLPALDRAAYWDNIWTIAGSAVSMSVFVVYIRTSASIMTMFSTETIEGVQYMKRDFGRRAWTNAHLTAVAIGSIYGFFFILGIPILAIYILFINHGQRKGRHIQAVFGFLFEGYRPKMYFWEFSVLLRKIVFLAISLFWEDAFLQSVVAVFTIIICITFHTSFWPYEQAFLNVVELLSLFSLFSLVVLSLLLWYVQMPGNDTNLVLYELSITFVLFVQYALVGTLLVGRLLYTKIREVSDKLVVKFPATRSMLVAAARFEKLVYFKVHGVVNPVGQEKLWTFIAADLAMGNENECDSDDEITVVSTWAKLRALRRVCCQACCDRRTARAEERRRAEALVKKRMRNTSTVVKKRVRRASLALHPRLRRSSLAGVDGASTGAIEMTANPFDLDKCGTVESTPANVATTSDREEDWLATTMHVANPFAFDEGGAVESAPANVAMTSDREEDWYLMSIYGEPCHKGPHTLAWLRASLMDEEIQSADTVRQGNCGEDEALNIVLRANGMFNDGWYYPDESDQKEFAGPCALFELRKWVKEGYFEPTTLVRQGEHGNVVTWVDASSAASAHDMFTEALDLDFDEELEVETPTADAAAKASAADATAAVTSEATKRPITNPSGRVWFFDEVDGELSTPHTLAELRSCVVDQRARGTATVRRGKDGDSVPLGTALLDTGMFQDGWYFAERPDAPFDGPFARWEIHEWLASEGDDTSSSLGLVRQGTHGHVRPVSELPREEIDAEGEDFGRENTHVSDDLKDV